jgi:hypothetical protein
MHTRDDNQILLALLNHGIDFVIIGAHAVNFHGYIRLTEDLDLVWLRSQPAEKNLLAALKEIGAEFISETIDPATGIERSFPVTPPYIESTHLMMLVTRLGFLDLFDYVPALPGEQVSTLFSSSIESNGFRYASLDWLRRMKAAAGRSKDLLDLEMLPE